MTDKIVANKEIIQDYFDRLVAAHGLDRAVQIVMEILLQKDSGFQLTAVEISFDFRDSNGEPFIVSEKLGPGSKIKLSDLLDLFMGRKS